MTPLASTLRDLVADLVRECELNPETAERVRVIADTYEPQIEEAVLAHHAADAERVRGVHALVPDGGFDEIIVRLDGGGS